jgi:TRAP-type C4-dicarboxylate transport system permease small subunit
MVEKLNKISKYVVYICGILLFASVFLIGTEVILRKFFLISFGGTNELSGYTLGIIISWSLAYVLFEKMHIRIDILYSRVPKTFQSIFDTVAMSFTLFFIGLLTYFSFGVFYTSWIKQSIANTPFGTPLWIPQGLWFLGFAFSLFVVLVLFLKSIKALIRNKSDDHINIFKEDNFDLSID